MSASVVDLTKETEATFFRCLHDEKPQDPRVAALRRKWHEKHKDKGLREKVLVLDTGDVGGLCQYIPIEHSPFLGRDLLAEIESEGITIQRPSPQVAKGRIPFKEE